MSKYRAKVAFCIKGVGWGEKKPHKIKAKDVKELMNKIIDLCPEPLKITAMAIDLRKVED